jgi:hypothetical protein
LNAPLSSGSAFAAAWVRSSGRFHSNSSVRSILRVRAERPRLRHAPPKLAISTSPAPMTSQLRDVMIESSRLGSCRHDVPAHSAFERARQTCKGAAAVRPVTFASHVDDASRPERDGFTSAILATEPSRLQSGAAPDCGQAAARGESCPSITTMIQGQRDDPTLDDSGSTFLFGSLLRRRSLLQDPLGPVELRPPLRAEILPAAIDEVLNHPDSGPESAGRHILSRHRPGNLGCRTGEGARRWMRGVGGDGSHPLPFVPWSPGSRLRRGCRHRVDLPHGFARGRNVLAEQT